MARYVDETRPDLMRDLLSKRHRPKELEEMLAQAYGISRERFWEGFATRVLDR